MAAEPGGHILYLKKRHCGQETVHSAFAVTIKRAYFFIFVKRIWGFFLFFLEKRDFDTFGEFVIYCIFGCRVI